MSKIINKITNMKKTKYFWTIIVLGSLLMIAGIILMPFWSKTNLFFASWGANLINIMIAVTIIAYLLFYLTKKVKKANYQTILILTIVEFVLLAVIALGYILSQFRLIDVGSACKILGLALWCRGTVEIFRAYYYKQDSSYSYPLWYLAIAIAMVTFGTFLFAKPLFTDVHLQWVFTCFIALIGLSFIIIGIIRKPKK